MSVFNAKGYFGYYCAFGSSKTLNKQIINFFCSKDTKKSANPTENFQRHYNKTKIFSTKEIINIKNWNKKKLNDRPWSKRTLEKKNTKSRSKKSSYIEAEKHKREGKEMVEEESTILSQCRLKSHWIFFLVFMVLSWLQIFFFFMWLLNKHKKSISIGSHGFKLDFVSKIWFGRSRKVFLVV